MHYTYVRNIFIQLNGIQMNGNVNLLGCFVSSDNA